MLDLYAWLTSFFTLLAILGLNLFQLLSWIDLECDYINPYETASRINKVVIPEFVTQGTLCLLHLFTGHWVVFLICLPCAYFNLRQYTEKRHLVDVTEIFNQLPWAKKVLVYKLGHVAVLMALSIFWMIWSIVEAE